MDRWLQKDPVVRVVALFLALLMWLFVVNEQNPQESRSLLVTPELRNLPPGLVLLDEVKPVTVRLRGRRNELYATGAAELGAYVDLGEASEGENAYPVRLTNIPPDLQLVQISPTEAVVNLESIVQQQIPVELMLRGTATIGYTVGTPVISPVHVLLEGPRSRVRLANRAVIRVDVEGAKDNVRVSVPVQILDNKGSPVTEGLRIKPEVIEVTVPVSRLPAKMVPVQPQIVGEPAEGYKVSQVLVDPERIAISGRAEMLAEIQSVSTLPLDVSGSTETKSADLRVALPQDVRAEVERVRVTAVLEPRTVQRSLDNVELKVRNLGENLAVELDPKRVQVTISGLYPVVNPITPADLVAYVNLKDLAAGEYEISVTLNLPDDVRAVAIEPSMVKVSINNPEPEGEEDKPASSDNKP